MLPLARNTAGLGEGRKAQHCEGERDGADALARALDAVVDQSVGVAVPAVVVVTVPAVTVVIALSQGRGGAEASP